MNSLNFFNLPVFLSIGEKLIGNLLPLIEREISDIRKKSIILFTSERIHSLCRKEIDDVSKQLKVSIVYVHESSYDIAVEYAKRISIENYHVVIGLGGGKILDTAKYASYVSKVLYLAIPTTLSNDGVASPIAVLLTENGKAKSFGCKSPDGIVIDTEMIKNSPTSTLMAGIGDTVSNFTALFDWKLESKYIGTRANDFAYLLSDTAFNMLLNSRETDIRSENLITQLAQSIILSGLAMNIAGNSRPCSGSEHLFSHALDEFYNIDSPHGLKVALGSVVSCIFQRRSYSPMLDFLSRFGVSVSPEKLGISKQSFIGAWLKAKSTRPERFTVLDTIELNDEYLNSVYYEVMEATI